MSGTIQELGVNSHKDTVPIFKELIGGEAEREQMTRISISV